MRKSENSFALVGSGGYIAKSHLQAMYDVNGILKASLDCHDSDGKIDSYFPDSDFLPSLNDLTSILKIKKKG